MKKLKVITVVGTRPEIIRLSRVLSRLDDHCEHIFVHTGQNYDFTLNEIFFEDLEIRMTAEDFSYYSQILPACFYRLGVGNESKGIRSSVHSPTFDIDEKALLVGVEVFVASVFNI